MRNTAARPGAGRPRGSVDKAVLEREKRINQLMAEATALLGPDLELLDPVEVMKIAMRVAAKAGWWFKAAELAEKVAPYVRPKLTSVTTTNGNPDESRSDDDLAAELAEIRSRQTVADRKRALEAAVPPGDEELGDPGTLAAWVPTGSSPRPPVHRA
jgi:hypothetical protein